MAIAEAPRESAHQQPERPGLQIRRHFTRDGVHPYDEVEWERRDAIIPGEGGTQLLGRIVGPSRALDLMLQGGSFGPDRALELGLVDRVVPADRLMAETEAYARKLTEGPIQAIGFLKIALTEGLEMPLPAGFAFERQLQNELLKSADSQEGARAFLEKRAPRFTGR